MPKPTVLVCQHLERFSRTALERHQDIIRDYVRRRHGVYALYRKDRLYYVGLARNLQSRLQAHLRDRHGKSWDRFSVYLTIGDSHIREIESLILKIVKPRGNVQVGRFAKAENLLSRLKRDIRRKQKTEFDELVGRPKSKLDPSSLNCNQGKVPVLFPYIDGAMKLRAKYKGRNIRAHVLKSGIVVFEGKRYNSPSMAAAAVCKRSCNGWVFWKYERGPHEWIRLGELRR